MSRRNLKNLNLQQLESQKKTTPKKSKNNSSKTPATKTATQNSKNLAAKNPRKTRKIPEALPLKSEQDKSNAFTRFTGRMLKKPQIQEVVREPTAGGIVYRLTSDRKDIEILLIQDSKGRWTIPKGHIEPGETAKQTAIREIGEESGLFSIQVMSWLGKINFQYRRGEKLVLMTTQIYLVQSLDENEAPTKEQWMKGIEWFKFKDALSLIEYEDIEKLMLLAKHKVRQGF